MDEVSGAVEQFMTAAQAEGTQFATVRKHGYDKAAVDSFVSRAADSLWRAEDIRRSLSEENAQLRRRVAHVQQELDAAREAFHEMVGSLQDSIRSWEELSDIALGETTDLHDQLLDALAAQPTADAAVEVVALAHTTAKATLDAAQERADALVQQARAEAAERRRQIQAEMSEQTERLVALAQAERDLRASLGDVLEGVRVRMATDVLAGDAVIAEVRRHLEQVHGDTEVVASETLPRA